MATEQSLAARCSASAELLASILSSLWLGVSSFFRGFVLVVKALASPAMFEDRKMLKELLLTPGMLIWVTSASGFMLVLCIPFTHWGWFEPSWNSLVQVSSLMVLGFVRQFAPQVAPHWFFHVLSVRDKDLSSHLASQPIVYGLRERVKRWLFMSVLGVAAVIALVACGPLLAHLPVIALLAGTVFATWQASLAILTVGGALLMLLSGSAYVYALLKPIRRLFDFDPILCWIAVAAIVLRCLSLASIGDVMKGGTVLYYSCTLMTAELLAQHGERLPQSDWERFQRRHCWEMFGFGLPVWMLMRFSPMTVVALLQALQGASSCLLVDLLAKDSLDKRGHDV